MEFGHSPRALDFLSRLRSFLVKRLYPVEEDLRRKNAEENFGGKWTDWRCLPEIDALKAEARQAGLWNLFLPDAALGQGLSTLEYAPLAEEMGRSPFAPEIFNCNAPDTGNMEVLYHYGTEPQKEEWLGPLLRAEIRSVFCMTEPAVASSDANNIRATIVRARVAIFMGLSDPNGPRRRRHSMVLVPLDSKGITIHRMLSTFGEYDPPYGHGEISLDNVRVPRRNLIQNLGDGFAIAQGRLGPGRIHHCMRAVGAAERALELFLRRGMSREAFGKPLLELGGNMERIADMRIAIHQARLATLHAAWRIDTVGAANAFAEISAIKVIAPNMLQFVIDEAIQLHGGAGMSADTPLASMFTLARTLRIVDGPDAVHRRVLARLELAKYKQG
jgi:acyl-CoA dehydrogenase